MDLEIRFADVDGDGEREVVVENNYLRAVLRFPEKLGYAFYKRRFTWGGRLQSLVYKPTGREFFLPQMIDLEDINPFGLPDELFATFPFSTENGEERFLKMGVGIFGGKGGEEYFEELPWTWHEEDAGLEKVVVFRQEAETPGGHNYLYEKRYRFRADAAFFALDVLWENRGESPLESAWDVHTFHAAGAPPHSAWLVAPKRAWLGCGNSRVRTFIKEASPIFATPRSEEMVADRILWDADGTPWWYATGPDQGDEFYLMRARFDPDWGMFWAGYDAFTPQAISNVEVPPGESAIWGFDVTLGTGGRHFVAAGEDCGLTLERMGERVLVGVHKAAAAAACLDLRVFDQDGVLTEQLERKGEAEPGKPFSVEVALPLTGDYATLELLYSGRDGSLHRREIVPLKPARPTAHLPFAGAAARFFVASHHDLERPEADGRYLWCHGTQSGFEMDWSTCGVRAPENLRDFGTLCLVGDAWPLERVAELRTWIEGGGGLLLCAPFGQLAEGLRDCLPLRPLVAASKVQPAHVAITGAGMQRYAEAEWVLEEGTTEAPRIWRWLHTRTLEQVDPLVGLQRVAAHETVDRLMLEPDAKVRIGYWVPCAAHPQALVTLSFTDEKNHPAVGLRQLGKGRIAAVASRPAWGGNYRKVVWDGWGQYHRAFWAGLMGWVGGSW